MELELKKEYKGRKFMIGLGLLLTTFTAFIWFMVAYTITFEHSLFINRWKVYDYLRKGGSFEEGLKDVFYTIGDYTIYHTHDRSFCIFKGQDIIESSAVLCLIDRILINLF